MTTKIVKNKWGEPYPNHKDLLENAASVIAFLKKELKKKSCPCLKKLYLPDKNGRMVKQNDVFKSIGGLGNAPFQKKKDKELMGLYVFASKVKDEIIPVYVGISRTIFRRLKQHGWGAKHNEASLAYLMAKKKYDHQGHRHKLKKWKLKEQQEIIREWRVAVYPIKNDYDLYFTEVFAAGMWGTKWNTFKTH